jgi:hypothetical protein
MKAYSVTKHGTLLSKLNFYGIPMIPKTLLKLTTMISKFRYGTNIFLLAEK